MMDLLSSRSRLELNEEERRDYYRLSLEAIAGLMTKWKRAGCLRSDPTGRASLEAAKLLRRKLKVLKRKNHDWERAMDKALKMLGSSGS